MPHPGTYKDRKGEQVSEGKGEEGTGKERRKEDRAHLKRHKPRIGYNATLTVALHIEMKENTCVSLGSFLLWVRCRTNAYTYLVSHVAKGHVKVYQCLQMAEKLDSCVRNVLTEVEIEASKCQTPSINR